MQAINVTIDAVLKLGESIPRPGVGQVSPWLVRGVFFGNYAGNGHCV